LPRAEAREQPLQEKGVLWGGNLAIVAALAGTPWMPQVKGGILFLEDVSEHPYRIERMLTQLLYTGVLQKQKAILLGHFTNWIPVPHDKGFKLNTVIEWLRSQVKAPVLTGLPFGHVPTKVCLPVGAKVTLAAEGRDAFLLWGHMHSAHERARARIEAAGQHALEHLRDALHLLAGGGLAHGGGERGHQVAAQVPQALDVVGVADAARYVGELLGARVAEEFEHRFADVFRLVLQGGVARCRGAADETIHAVAKTAFEPTHVTTPPATRGRGNDG
jgi:hypothetical protein